MVGEGAKNYHILGGGGLYSPPPGKIELFLKKKR